MDALHDPALTVTLALAAGIVAQSLAQHLRVPGIVLVLAAGVLLGPDVAGVVRPEALGEGLTMIVGLAVAVVLFEGGLSLNLSELRREARTIRRLISIGALVTALGATLAARLFMGWTWQVSALFGTLVIVTGPTVITPLLRRIRVTRHLRTILEAEGVLIDPVGAIVAVVALEVVVATGAQETASGLLGLPFRFGVGLGMGFVGGWLIGLLLRYERVVPEGLENVFTLALVLALFETSEAVLAESGILTVAIAGMVVANMETRVQRELKEFKEQLTVLLVGLLFVLLAADVRVSEVVALGWPAVATVVALMLVVRPLNVVISAAGSELGVRDKLFLSWVAPRGIVAAAIASLFAQSLEAHGMAGGQPLLAMVFLVIAATVVVQGATTGVVARLLGVRRPENHGFILVGANAVGRALGCALREEEADVVLIDTNAAEAQAAEQQGLRVVYGNANDERTLLQADIEARRGFVAITPNEGVNLLLADKARNHYRVPRCFVALLHRRLGVQDTQVRELGASILFGVPVDMEQWAHELLQGTAVVEAWRFTGHEGTVGRGRDPGRGSDAPRAAGEGSLTGEPKQAWALPEAFPVLPMVLTRGRRVEPTDDTLSPREGDRVHFAWLERHDADVREWLAREGWEPAERPAGAPSDCTEAAGGGTLTP